MAARGRIDGLVNNAGGQYITPLESITAKGWEAVVNTNLTGGFLFARECYVQSMQARGGAIVNIVADIWGSMPGMGHSGAARAGMVSFTETAALEWARSGVRVNAVAPGYVETDLVKTAVDEGRITIEPIIARTPARRLAAPEEIAATIVFLCSDEASYVCGHVFHVDGGFEADFGVPFFPPKEPGAR